MEGPKTIFCYSEFSWAPETLSLKFVDTFVARPRKVSPALSSAATAVSVRPCHRYRVSYQGSGTSCLSVTWGSWCLATPPASIPGPCGLSGSSATASWSGFWAVCWPEADGWAEQCRTLWDVQVCSQHVYPSGSRDVSLHWPTSVHRETNAVRVQTMKKPFPAVRARGMEVIAQIWARRAKTCCHLYYQKFLAWTRSQSLCQDGKSVSVSTILVIRSYKVPVS
jgi:hypothetical protein